MEIEIKTNDAKEMADKGENGDTVMGHLTPGEIVLPLPLAQKLEPVLKKAFEMMDMDIEQYTVGHEKNSMNKESGCPEFATNPREWNVTLLERMMASSPDLALSIRKELESQEQKEKEAAEKAQEAEAQSELKKAQQEMADLQKQIQEETAAGQAQIAKTKQETESTQRELGERKLSRVRARVRSLSRPMLSKGVSL